jgi:hypothetical protein
VQSRFGIYCLRRVHLVLIIAIINQKMTAKPRQSGTDSNQHLDSMSRDHQRTGDDPDRSCHDLGCGHGDIAHRARPATADRNIIRSVLAHGAALTQTRCWLALSAGIDGRSLAA